MILIIAKFIFGVFAFSDVFNLNDKVERISSGISDQGNAQLGLNDAAGTS